MLCLFVRLRIGVFGVLCYTMVGFDDGYWELLWQDCKGWLGLLEIGVLTYGHLLGWVVLSG